MMSVIYWHIITTVIYADRQKKRYKIEMQFVLYLKRKIQIIVHKLNVECEKR